MPRIVRRSSIAEVDTKPLFDQLCALRAEIVRVRQLIPLKSPARHALGALIEQIDEIVGYLTGDHAFFKGKPHSARF